MRRAFLTCALGIVATAASSQETDKGELSVLKADIKGCATQKKTDARVKCYDALAKRIATPAKTEEEIKAEADAKAAVEQEQGYITYVENAKQAVTESFKDPGSAQWRGLFLTGGQYFWNLCGEVNAKNSYGAYVGYRRFFSLGGQRGVSTQIEGKETARFFDKFWQETCMDEPRVYTAR